MVPQRTAVPGSRTAHHHRATYGEDFSYYDFRRSFDAAAANVDFADWARCFARAGARYVVMVTRHLDGYPLWPTRVANPHMPRDFRSQRDLVGDLTVAVRAQDLRMGLYYGGGLDWTFTEGPIRTMTDLRRQQAAGAEWVVNDRWTQLRQPSNRLARALYHRFVAITLKAMNRAGRPLPAQPAAFHHDFETHEYATPDPAPASPWELTRGLGRSFGFSAQEAAADTLTGTQLVHLLADVVAHGGNLLINVGPDGSGRIPDVQRHPLRELGAWLAHHGDAIYATRPWTTAAAVTTTGRQVRFTQKGRTVYAIVLSDDVAGGLTIRDLTLPAGSRIGVLDGPADIAWTQAGDDVRIAPPPHRPSPHAAVLTITEAA